VFRLLTIKRTQEGCVGFNGSGCWAPPNVDAVNLVAFDARNFEIQADNGVGVIFLRFPDQRLDRLQSVSLADRVAGGAPAGGGPYVADRAIGTTAFELIDMQRCFRAG